MPFTMTRQDFISLFDTEEEATAFEKKMIRERQLPANCAQDRRWIVLGGLKNEADFEADTDYQEYQEG